MEFTPLTPAPQLTTATTPVAPAGAATRIAAAVQAANTQTVASLAATAFTEAARSSAALAQAVSSGTPAVPLNPTASSAASVPVNTPPGVPAGPTPANVGPAPAAPAPVLVAGATASSPASNLAPGGTAPAPGTAAMPAPATLQPAGDNGAWRPAATAPAPDVYHGADIPPSPNLLTQKGVGAYIQLLNVLAGSELHEKSAELLTTSLQNASAALKLAYYSALTRLPSQLAQKAWGFSVSNGSLVFTGDETDTLSPLEMTALRNAFASANVESAARQVAVVITSIEQMRKSGGDSGSLAWAHFNVDETNFGSVVDLRNFVIESAPGSHYHPSGPILETPSQVPPMLGGLDLRELVTTRPKFLRADGTVNPEALEGFDVPAAASDVATLHGRCSCGQVRFIAEDRFEYAFYCHCSRCRARTGSAFAAIAGVPIDRIEVVAGHEHLLLEGECSDGYGARCSHCYAFLFSAVRGRQYLHVSLGILTDTPSRIPDHHIYVGSKAPWFHITDGLPQYDELP